MASTSHKRLYYCVRRTIIVSAMLPPMRFSTRRQHRGLKRTLQHQQQRQREHDRGCGDSGHARTSADHAHDHEYRF